MSIKALQSSKFLAMVTAGSLAQRAVVLGNLLLVLICAGLIAMVAMLYISDT